MAQRLSLAFNLNDIRTPATPGDRGRAKFTSIVRATIGASAAPCAWWFVQALVLSAPTTGATLHIDAHELWTTSTAGRRASGRRAAANLRALLGPGPDPALGEDPVRCLIRQNARALVEAFEELDWTAPTDPTALKDPDAPRSSPSARTAL